MTRPATFLLRTLVWGLAGVIFGGLYGGLTASFSDTLNNILLTTTVATALAGAITAAFFGSMLTALLGAMIGVLVSVIFLVAFAETGEFIPLLAAAAGLAFLAGKLLPHEGNLIIRPIAQIVSGFLAGLCAGPLITIAISSLSWNLHSAWAAGIGVALVGVLFLVFSYWIVPWCPDWLSSRFSSSVVAAIIAGTVAAALWLMGSSIGHGGGHLTPAEIDVILAAVPKCATGGAIGGALGGVGLEILGIERRGYRI